jgi:hypothetical protein
MCMAKSSPSVLPIRAALFPGHHRGQCWCCSACPLARRDLAQAEAVPERAQVLLLACPLRVFAIRSGHHLPLSTQGPQGMQVEAGSPRGAVSLHRLGGNRDHRAAAVVQQGRTESSHNGIERNPHRWHFAARGLAAGCVLPRQASRCPQTTAIPEGFRTARLQHVRPHVTSTIQVEITIATKLMLQQEMSEIRPRVLPDDDSHTLDRMPAGTASPDADVSGAAQQASARARAIKVDAAGAASVLRACARASWGSMRIVRSTRPHGAYDWRGPSRSPSGNSSVSTSALPKRRSDGSHASTARRGQ